MCKQSKNIKEHLSVNEDLLNKSKIMQMCFFRINICGMKYFPNVNH